MTYCSLAAARMTAEPPDDPVLAPERSEHDGA